MQAHIKGELKVRPVYQCPGCGIQVPADGYYTMEVDTHAKRLDFKAKILGLPGSPVMSSLVPVGWHSWGHEGVFCPHCQSPTKYKKTTGRV